MKLLTKIAAVGLAAAYLAAPLTALAADKSTDKKEDKKEAKAKAYPLDTCIVSDEKLGSMGDPYVFTHEGQEIKLCCKSCQKEFKKTPNKFVNKLKKTEKK